MRPHERLVARCCLVGVALLFFALVGIDVRAAALGAGVMPHMGSDAGMASHPAPVMADCDPCVYCYTGPLSTLQGFGGEPRQQDAHGWSPLAKAAPASALLVETRANRLLPVPARIAYCRWSK